MYPLDILGISAESDSLAGETSYSLNFNQEADEQTIARLISEIPPEIVFQFYDGEYKSSSDPGAFVRVKHSKDKYIMQRTNHGWYTRWKRISYDNLVSYLSKCINWNRGEYSMNKMRVYPEFKKNKQWWQFWK